LIRGSANKGCHCELPANSNGLWAKSKQGIGRRWLEHSLCEHPTNRNRLDARIQSLHRRTREGTKPNDGWFCGKRNLEIMKSKPVMMTVILSLVVLAFGCHKEPTAAERMDNAKTEAATVARDMKDYSFAQKNEFVTKMQGQLDALNKDLEELSAKIERSSDAVKADAKPKLQVLRDQTSGLSKQLEDVRNATESTWDSLKATSEKAFDSVKGGLQQARQWMSDKIAP